MRGFSLKSFFGIDWGFAEGKLPLESVLVGNYSWFKHSFESSLNGIAENAWLIAMLNVNCKCRCNAWGFNEKNSFEMQLNIREHFELCCSYELQAFYDFWEFFNKVLLTRPKLRLRGCLTTLWSHFMISYVTKLSDWIIL